MIRIFAFTFVALFITTAVHGRTQTFALDPDGVLAGAVTEIDDGLVFTITRDLMNGADGWFAFGFPDNNKTMKGSTVVIATYDEGRIYNIEQTSHMQSDWRIYSHAFLNVHGLHTDSEKRVLEISVRSKTLADVGEVVYSFSTMGGEPEDSSCYHYGNKAIFTLEDRLNPEPEYFYLNFVDTSVAKRPETRYATIQVLYEETEIIFSNPAMPNQRLSKDDTYKWNGIVQGDYIKSTKPIVVLGRYDNQEWMFQDSENSGNKFAFGPKGPGDERFLFFNQNSFKIDVNVYVREKKTAQVLIATISVKSQEVVTFQPNTLNHISDSDIKHNIVSLESEHNFLVSSVSGTFMYYLNGIPASQTVYGSASAFARVLTLERNFDVDYTCYSTIEVVESDRVSDVYAKSIKSDRAHAGSFCKFSAVSDENLISVSALADGSGAAGIMFQRASDFGVYTALPATILWMKIISQTSESVCTVGGDKLVLEGVDGGLYSIYTTTPYFAGSTINCNNPVIIFVDFKQSKDETVLPMYSLDDSCTKCMYLEESQVCTVDGTYYNGCRAECVGLSYTDGKCQTYSPTRSPTLSPTDTTSPTQSPTPAPIDVLDENSVVGKLKTFNGQISRQLLLQQSQHEHDVRSRGSSGVTRTRSRHDGIEPMYADGSVLSGGNGIIAVHNHPNTENLVGMGEFGAILNGVRFDTRHNDYKIVKPAQNAHEKYNELEPIEWPEVPESVSELNTVEKQVNEMKEYFRAFHKQDATIRPYKEYFKAVICYLEGAWILDDGTDSLKDPFDSDRHEIDAKTWKDQNASQIFRAASGKKNVLENQPFLPTKIVEIVLDEVNGISYPVFARYEYRIACQPLKDDVPTDRFILDVDDHIFSRTTLDNKNKNIEHVRNSRAAHFKLNPTTTEKWNENIAKGKANRNNDYKKTFQYSYLDEIMAQIPGKDGPNAKALHDNSFRSETREFLNASKNLNVGYYSRLYSYTGNDAMGRQQDMRGYNDVNMFSAMTSHPNVASNKVCKTFVDEITKEKTEECWVQRWTHSIPLEIIYLTPLEKWNPCGLTRYENKSGFADANRGKAGTVTNPYFGYGKKDAFVKTPASLFAAEGGRDLADTSRGFFSEGVDPKGNTTICQVVSSGTQIVTDPMDFGGDKNERVRLRYPIFPVHDHTSIAFKETAALKYHTEQKIEKIQTNHDKEINVLKNEISDLHATVQLLLSQITSSTNYNDLIENVNDVSISDPDWSTIGDYDDNSNDDSDLEIIGRYTVESYPEPRLQTNAGIPDNHIHEIVCDWNCFTTLMEGGIATVESEVWDTHTHEFKFKLGESGHIIQVDCNSCGDSDPHNHINLDPEYPEVFTVPV